MKYKNTVCEFVHEVYIVRNSSRFFEMKCLNKTLILPY